MGSCSSLNTFAIAPKNISGSKLPSTNQSSTIINKRSEKYNAYAPTTMIIHSKTKGIREAPILKPLDGNSLFQNRMRNSKVSVQLESLNSIPQAKTGVPSFVNCN